MLARTHGQPATPTTIGKEFANFVMRLKKQRDKLAKIEIMGKFNGATGNFNAHLAAFPELDWQTICQKFVADFGLTWNSHTTQIESHDYIVEISNSLTHINNILIGFCRDMWGYISLNYFTQITPPNHQAVGSSVMPYKINPIDFENAEGNLGLANALLQHFANKLPISRWQRDLSDSTVMRNIGSSFAYCLIAYKSIGKGLQKIAVNKEFLQSELDQHWEVLAEAIQTTMRRYGMANAYEKLRELTRGKKIDCKIIAEFIDKLDIPADAKERLKKLTPSTYIGLAAKLAKEV
jgi:adenylosuccinate lyase